MLIQMVNIKEGNFNFPMYNILISQSSVHTIGKFEQIAKITFYVISQGYLTPWGYPNYLHHRNTKVAFILMLILTISRGHAYMIS